MPELPTGTVTFLFTDLEGSTRLWEQYPEAMKEALARHDEILRDAINKHDGHIVKMTGDGVHGAFAHANDAVRAAVEAQRGFSIEVWDQTGPLRVRMGVHTGPAQHRDGDYYGTAVNRAARLMSAAHGGQVLASLATEELLRDDGADVVLIDLGEHRLRDLSQPEHVFQVVHRDLRRDFPPVQSLDRYLGNLPLQTTSFVGRELEVKAVADALRASSLVTITGVGGVGKTRLAIQVAAEMLPEFDDGAWLCEIAAASDEDSMLQVVAASLGSLARPEGSFAEALPEYLRTKRLLLVLDNCEHVLDAVARLAESILQRCTGVVVLATSREGFGIVREQVWPLRSLSLPPQTATVDELAFNAAVELFVERARQVKPAFALEAGNAVAISEICERLDGMPLAIELAAARVAAMNPADIARRLDERFRLLTGGRRTAVERHQTLRATVDWSYSLLAERAQRVFDRLGVFPGTFDADAVEAIIAGDDLDAWEALDALADLVTKSMVDQEESVVGSARYRMLETLRQYAREQLDESDDPDAWRRRHAQHYAAVAREIRIGIDSRAENVAARQRFDEERDNLRAAVTWALDAPSTDDCGLGFLIVAELVSESAVRWNAGLGAWAERALERAAEIPRPLLGPVLAAAAFSAYGRGDWEAMRELAEAAVDRGALDGNPSPVEPYQALATALTMLGDTAGAESAVADGLRIAETIGNSRVANLLKVVDASNAAGAGDTERMRARADAALEEARRSAHPMSMSGSLYVWGWAHMDDEPLAAERALEESLLPSEETQTVTNVCSLLARLRARRGDAPGAASALLEAVTVARNMMNRGGFATSLERGVDVFAVCHRSATAAVLAGAATRGPLRAMRMIGVHERDPRRALQERLRDDLGDEQYEACMARGAGMSYEEILDFVVDELDSLQREFDDA